MKAVCVIPARLESTRLPRKLLRRIGGKYLIQFAYERAKQARKPERVVVACDHEELARAVESFGGEAVMTGREHQSGTERIAEVARSMKAEIFVNLQADEPLMHPSVVDDLIGVLEQERACQMATACVKLRDAGSYADPSVVKVVRDKSGNALYFSRSPIPRDREANPAADFLKHLGIYAYRRSFLLKLPGLAPSELERRERLEQLRVLENGHEIRVIETAHDSIGVDTEEDLKKVEELLKSSAREDEIHA
jgi:3-deoxy-manno-octulosonate cytidylyltransferase (CMP-KDO synthetase)